MKELILFRGLPGSGKTTLANILCESVYSADDFFTDNEGNYNFDASMIKEAHQECKNNVEYLMSKRISKIAVANTFTQEWEMRAYFDLAQQYGYRVHTVVVENRHNSTDVHGVPVQVKEKMSERFEVEL